MCTGAILLYKIPRVVIGENSNFRGDEDRLRSRGVEVLVVDDDRCKQLMSQFIALKPQVRNPLDVVCRANAFPGLVRGHRRDRGIASSLCTTHTLSHARE